MPLDPGARPLRPAPPADATRTGVEARAVPVVGVCSSDAVLLATLRDAAPDLAIAAVDSPHALADLLLGRGCFTAFLDVRGLGGRVATLVPALARQFPSLPIVAVGTRGEEAAVARLIGSGEVYRFLHVPVSTERARTFLGAARRRADELQQRYATSNSPRASDEDADDDRASDGNGDAALPLRTVAPPPRVPAAPAVDPARSGRGSHFRATLFALTALGLAVAAGTTWLSRPEPAAVRTPSTDPIVADLVGAAGAAATAGDLLTPAGRSAADYYREALARRPADPEARASLLALADRMLGAGERALVDGRWQEAGAAANTVALVRPRDPRVVALRARAEAARVAAEAAPVAPSADAARVPPSGNTDERAGFEDARDARAALPIAAPARANAESAVGRIGAGTNTGATSASTGVGAGTAVDAGTSEGAAPAVPPTMGNALAAPVTRAAPAGTHAAPEGAPAAIPQDATVAIAAPDLPEATAPASPGATAPSRPPPRPVPVPVPVPLRKVEDVAVVYPPRARSRGIEGWVDVAFTVDASGRVTGARVLSGQPAGTFDEATLAAVRRWRYAPPPVPQEANVRLRFRLDR
jgi:TonB family protein